MRIDDACMGINEACVGTDDASIMSVGGALFGGEDCEAVQL